MQTLTTIAATLEAAVVEASAAAVEALLHMEVVAVVQALAVVHALAADRVRALVPNAARADGVWEIAARPEAFTIARQPRTRTKTTAEIVAILRSATTAKCTTATKATA